jgi:hypothetical protein
MIVYLKNHEIDKVQWDICIKNSPGVKPYAFSWYLDIMAPGWEALVDDDYDSAFPLPARTRLGIRYLATPIFLQQLGAFSPDKPPDQTINEFLDYIPDFFRLIDLCVSQKTGNKGFHVTEKTNFELDLSKPYETIFNNFLPYCKRNVETSARKKINLDYDISPSELIDLFINNKGKELKNIKQSDYLRLSTLMDFCLNNNKGTIIGSRDSGKKIIFGIFLIETPGFKSPFFVVNTPESRKKMIAYYVINEIIKTNSSKRTILDFAGSSIPSIAFFMESFGGKNVPYYRLYRNRLLWPIRIMK